MNSSQTNNEIEFFIFFKFHAAATVAYSIMTTTETSDGESAERNASRRHQNERTSPSAEGTDFQMVTFKENGTSSKQI